MGTQYQLVDNGNGNMEFEPYRPPHESDVGEEISSSFKWAVAGDVVTGLVGTVAFIWVMYAIIDCVQKLIKVVPALCQSSSQ
ncbi:hypothetical protein TIFTF001_021194 [Ficus carica]|uniref:Uncharacterized protein n=1 Tax=Ficus carica TaxID=3494 RepID=A0AA88AYP1_FICCA|nr:hypothetical protein TIFTF001_021194 [Ficus carica]